MSGSFEIYTDNADEYRVRLKVSNSQNILASEGCTTKASCLICVEYSLGGSSYERGETKDGRYYFNLKVGNHQVIGASQSFEAVASNDNGVEKLKNHAPNARVNGISDG